MSARCETHGLAVGAEGRCVVCRREESVRVVPARPRSGVLVAVLLCSGLVAISVGATALSIALPVPGLREAPASAMASDHLAPPLADPVALPDETESLPPDRVAPPPPPPDFPRSEGSSISLEASKRKNQERNVRAQQARLEAWAHREAQASMAEDDERARRAVAGQRAESALSSGQVSVIMYSASWCRVCSAARSYMQQAQIPFTERDIDADPSAHAILRQLNPNGSVPTFDIGGTPLIGFRPESLNRAIAMAARR
jgi:glutaredoxin